MIAISFALPAEGSDLVSQLRDKRAVTRGSITIIQGKIDNHAVEIFYTGVGRKSCESKIDDFFRDERPRYFIAAGFAGSVRDDLPAGDLILAGNVSHPTLLSKAREVLHAREVTLYTSPAIVDSIEQRNETARISGADAVDMETEIIAQACNARGVPMLSLRVVSDSPGRPFPAPPRVLFDMQLQRTKPAKLLGYLLTHPPALWRLIRFGRQVGKARAKLAGAIVDLLRNLYGTPLASRGKQDCFPYRFLPHGKRGASHNDAATNSEPAQRARARPRCGNRFAEWRASLRGRCDGLRARRCFRPPLREDRHRIVIPSFERAIYQSQ
jgi:nucleoside phosphorylase